MNDTRHYLYAALVVLLMIFAQNMDYEAAVATEAMTVERMQELAIERTTVLTACMRGGRFVWREPHSQMDYAVYCDLHRLGKVDR